MQGNILNKEKVLYQVKLILECLPDFEYKMIPKEKLDYIEKNYEYDENIKINPNLPLEEQDIDEKTYEMLDEIVKSIESSNSEWVDDSENIVNKEENNALKNENINLKNIIENLKEENKKIPKAKELLEEYKEALSLREEEIEKLKKDNQELYNSLKKVPSVFRKIFLKENDVKLLKDNKN